MDINHGNLKHELNEYLDTLHFDSKEDKDIIYEFYRQLIEAKEFTSLYYLVPKNKRNRGDSLELWERKCILDNFYTVGML